MRRGFTLLEVLIVVAVIAILGAILLLGGRGLIQGGKERETRVAIAGVRNMLAEMDVKTAMRTKPTIMYSGGALVDITQPPYPAARVEFWNTYDRQPMTTNGLIRPLASPGLVDDGAGMQSDAVRNTVIAVETLLRMPTNRDMLHKMSDRVMNVPSVFPVTVPPVTRTSVVFKDSWGNPIIFVPASGLGGVTTAGGAVTITSDGAIPATQQPREGLKPFWASAGADGDFSKGDDNVYSFGE